MGSSPSPLPVPTPLPGCSVTLCPELDLSLNLSPAPKNQPQQNKQRERPRPLGPNRKKRNAKVGFREPLTAEPEPHQQPSSSSGHHHGAGGGSVDPTFQNQSRLEKAELNSTLALKVELQTLQEEAFDPHRALQETLQNPGRTRALMDARAAEEVNVSRSQILFSSLVSVSVQEDQLLSQVLQDRLMLAPPPPCCHDNKTGEGPSLHFFIDSDLYRQKPLPLEEGPPVMKASLSPCPASSTFDLYRRQRCWETAP
ncbi:protein phosphatase 1 regulatory subunit 35 [Cyprinodon tularosa]|uniref:protein phosphatase 1 regulatory subunit 35 n=1 Tax=Cyprinodon tularosa TaxID=77115 RepID=UPI0018E1F713|nr:protein phosphatase 1 regulatory subunit 35 [Cyprinodon tularosa]